MRTSKIYVEAKKSSNFQTYTVGIEIELDKKTTDCPVNEVVTDEEIRLLQTRARRLCNEQIAIDQPRRKDITPKYPPEIVKEYAKEGK